MPRFLTTYLESRTPAWARALGPDGVRRAHVLLIVSVLLQSQALAFGVLYLAIGAAKPALFLMVIGLCLVSLPLVLARRPRLAVHWVSLLVLVALDGLSWWTGGIEAPALWWTVLLPVLATLAGGRAFGVPWLLLAAANAVGFAVLGELGIAGENVLPRWALPPVEVAGISLLGFAVWAVAQVHETTRVEMVRAVAATNEGLRRVLDNVGQGFLMADAHGVMSEARSAVLYTWFGDPRPGEPLWAWIGRGDERFAAWLQIAWEAVFEGVMPVEVTVDQLPRRLERGGRVYSLAWRPVGDEPTALLVIVSDLTAEVEGHHTEQLLRERTGLLERLRRDPIGLLQFYDECERLLASLDDRATDPRLALHTLKGNCSVYGLQSVADQCHRVETAAIEAGGHASDADLDALRLAWMEIIAPTQDLLREERARVVVPKADLFALERAVAQMVPHDQLAAMLENWRYERTADALQRLAERAEALARRLGKPVPRVVLDDHGLRVDPRRWAGVWQAMIHVVRNAIDHGIEAPDVRVAAGKAPVATLQFATSFQAGAMVVSVEDDGRGVDWARVAAIAAERGMPHASLQDLEAVLFANGVSTRDEVTEFSGRGVGLGALLQAAQALGGELRVQSTTGCGTTVRVIVPEDDVRRMAA